MNSDYKDRRPFRAKGVIHSFQYALKGIKTALAEERNMRIHFSVSIAVILLGLITKITATEWLFVLIAIGGVFSLELINSSIERVVDLVTKEYHPLAKQAKDLAAGAVFIYAILSVIVGMIIFLPRLI
ncbi:diacylglycerol kinase family protein [Bacillus dakarensis]|uniref:diacylglycerol kinase family protein n=1 Tax=Robertmurraya dakarensis TaxID=1926278 RepID=UPI000980E634|nr:diacylglycerol kinase family protein [Bacillus dakarensis]